MTSISVLKKNENVISIEIKGHTNYEDIGKDIVCASISSIVTTTVNAILRLDNESITYDVKDGYINLKILKHDKYTDILITNMLDLLKELSSDYPKNVKINI